MTVKNNLEPTQTYQSKIKILEKQMEESKKQIDKSLEDQKEIFLNVLSSTKIEVDSKLKNAVEATQKICSETIYDLKSDTTDRLGSIQTKIDSLDKEHNLKNIQLYNSLNAYKKQVDTIHFDIIDNEDNVAIPYVNPNGKLEYGAIKKVLPDNNTIKLDKDNKLYLNYTFNPKTFKIGSNNEISATDLFLKDGNYLNADRINSDLNNANYNVKKLTLKLEAALQKLNNINGYLASNNFKKANPDQEQLNNFAISCISDSNKKINVDLIPAGTKIKNTFDNHIWVFNKFTYTDGLTSYKWEDFGADTICIAGNDGVHGLITGSNDHLKAFVDVNGIVSINGLEESLNDILKSLSELNTQIKDIQSSYDDKIINLETRLRQLENKNA